MAKAEDNIHVGVDICSGSLGDTLEIWSKYDVRLGSCSLDTLDSQQQPKFHFEESKDLIVFNETREQCVDKVVAYDMGKQSQIMNCGKWYNMFSCSLSTLNCKSQKFALFLVKWCGGQSLRI